MKELITGKKKKRLSAYSVTGKQKTQHLSSQGFQRLFSKVIG